MAATRSRLVALGLSVGAVAGLVAGMAATATPQPVAVQPPAADPGDDLGPVAAEPAGSPFEGQRSMTQSGAS